MNTARGKAIQSWREHGNVYSVVCIFCQFIQSFTLSQRLLLYLAEDTKGDIFLVPVSKKKEKKNTTQAK